MLIGIAVDDAPFGEPIARQEAGTFDQNGPDFEGGFVVVDGTRVGRFPAERQWQQFHKTHSPKPRLEGIVGFGLSPGLAGCLANSAGTPLFPKAGYNRV
jgi:hypothetical protein